MQNQVYLSPGDITRLQADAVAVPVGLTFGPNTDNFNAFVRHAGQEYNFKESYYNRRSREGWDEDGLFVKTGQMAFWVTCSQSRRPYGVVYVHCVNSSAQAAVRNAILGTVNVLRTEPFASRTNNRHLLIGLVAFRMGLGPDKFHWLESARAQVRAAYETIAELDRVDVAFVLPKEGLYDVFLDARREVRKELGISVPIPISAETAPVVTALQRGECVCFVGAGMSQNAHLASYRSLITHMAHEVGMEGDVPNDLDAYLDIAQWYRDTVGQEPGKEVTALIEEWFGKGEALPSLAHLLLASLPARFYITTNYDRLLEDSLDAQRRPYLRVEAATEVARTGYQNTTCVVKLHGDALSGEVVLSRNDYDTFFHKRPEMAALLEGLLLNQTFLFLGYGLRDPNFRQIYSKIRQTLQSAQRPAYVVALADEPEYTRRRYERSKIELLEIALHGWTGEGVCPPSEYERLTIAFLDRLSEEVERGGRFFLSHDANHPVSEETHPLHDLKRQLSAVAETVRRRIVEWDKNRETETPSLSDVRTVVGTLLFLAAQGWRPLGKPNVSLLFLYLSEHVVLAGGTHWEAYTLVSYALRYAEEGQSIHRLRKALADYEAKLS